MQPTDPHEATGMGRAAGAGRGGIVVPPSASVEVRAEAAFYEGLAAFGRAVREAAEDPSLAAEDPDAPAVRAAVAGAAMPPAGAHGRRRAAWAAAGLAACAGLVLWVLPRTNPPPEPAAPAGRAAAPVAVAAPAPAAPAPASEPAAPAGWIRVAAARACVEVGGGRLVCGRTGARFRVIGPGARVELAGGAVEVASGDDVVAIAASGADPNVRVDLGTPGEVYVLVLAGVARVEHGQAPAASLAPGEALRIDTSGASPAPEAKPAPSPAARARPAGRSAAALLDAAQRAAAAGDARRAAASYRALVRRYPHTPEAVAALPALGNLELRLGRPRSALAAFDRYLASGAGATRIEALRGRARALAALGRAEAARRAWRTLLAEDPDGVYADEARKKAGGP